MPEQSNLFVGLFYYLIYQGWKDLNHPYGMVFCYPSGASNTGLTAGVLIDATMPQPFLLEIMGDKAYKERHKALGLCQDCSSPAEIKGYCLKHYWRRLVKDRQYSEEHRQEINERVKRWHLKNIEQGRCSHCGVPLIEGEGKRCVNCSS